jgi:hypothetical protein
MRSQPRRRWFPVAATMVAAAVLLVAAVVILPYPGKTATTTQASTTTATSLQTKGGAPISTTDYNSSLGLLLTLDISNSTVSRNDGISMRISLNNTLATQNSLSPPQDGSGAVWPPSWNLQPCSAFPVGVQVFQGNYAFGNLSQGEPLGLIVPSGYNCADHPRSEISFAPLSGNITSPGGWWINQSSASIEYWGYWTGSAIPPAQNATFRSFEPGTYTIEGEDWWGQLTVLHFQVVTNEDPLDCATIASNSSYVELTNFSASAGPLKLESYYENLRSNNTVMLELSTTGDAALAVSNPYTDSIQFGIGSFIFSPDATLAQTWQYYAPNGTLGYPAFVYPDECSLISVNLQSSRFAFEGIPLIFATGNLAVGNQTQTFTLDG